MNNAIPIYTLLALIFLVPPIFFILWKDSRLHKKKLIVVLFFCIVATIIWDTVGIRFGIWGFLRQNTSWWILGIPLEEYVFGLWLPTVVLGIYTLLPKFKHHSIKEPHLGETTLLCIVFCLQILTLVSLSMNPVSYIKWLLFLAVIPSLFYLWRKGEKIDEVRLLATCLLFAAVVIIIDSIFVPLGAWHYNEAALLGHIGYVYFDDLLFGIFNAIAVVGFYTALPSKNIFTGKW